MFRKPKRKLTDTLRKKPNDEEDIGADDNDTREAFSVNRPHGDEEDDNGDNTTELLSEAQKRVKSMSSNGNSNRISTLNSQGKSTASGLSSSSSTMKSFASTTNIESSAAIIRKNAELATSTAQHHPDNVVVADGDGSAERGADGIFRDKTRNKFLAGPLRAAQNVRVTARFDYQPDICKDYKETGFCGFGDTCIYLHDRGDTLTGWQLEQQWEEQQKKKKEQQEKEIQGFLDGTHMAYGGGDSGAEFNRVDSSNNSISNDGLPFACFLCRDYFKAPVVTNCNHYFCEQCIMDHVRKKTENCPICAKDTGSVFNHPSKLVMKKKRILGLTKDKAENSWQEFMFAFTNK